MGCSDRSFEGVLLACDLDGTLLSPDGTLHPDNVASLREFLAAGGRFVVATGRTQASVTRNVPTLPADLPGIFCNGAHVYDRVARRTVIAHELPASAQGMIRDILDRFPSVGLEIFTDKGAHLVRSCDVLRLQLASEDLQYIEADPEGIPGPWLKILLGGEPDELAPIRAHLERFCSEDWEFVASDAYLLDLMAAGVSKGAALRELQALLERDGARFRTVAVGDNDNDVDMLRVADFGIAPENATQGARAAAGFVVPHHAEPVLPGVFRILRDELWKNTK